MRGKEAIDKINAGVNRITPAYAGKSRKCPEPAMWNWDHPRLCGEKGFDIETTNTQKGSPPPMRGKVIIRAGFGVNGRITPAYAGKSSVAILSISPFSGSPPPMRGKVSVGRCNRSCHGITPAYAGKR